MRSLPWGRAGAGGGVAIGAGMGRGRAPGGGVGAICRKTAGGGRNTTSRRSTVVGSSSSGLFAVGGWLSRTMSRVRWRVAETRKPCR